MYRFEYALQLSMLLSVILGIVLALIYRRSGWPWLLAAFISGFSFALYATLGQTDLWARALVASLAALNPATTYLSGLVLGVIAVVFGWRHGKTA